MSAKPTYCVYAHYNTKDNMKVYIGQTRRKPEHRFGKNGNGYEKSPYFWNAIQKYGWDAFEHHILISGLSKEDADWYEQRYIHMTGSNDPSLGYNLAAGGRGAPESPSKVRHVAMFDLTGKRVRNFYSITECANYLGVNSGSVTAKLTAKKGTIANHICHYLEEVEGIDQLPPEMIYFPNEQRSSLKTVSAYTVDGQYVATFPSIKEAARVTGVPSNEISSVLTRGRHTAQGYQWRYGDSNSENIEPAIKRGEATREGNHYAARQVFQYDHETCQLIARYPSVVSAARKIGCGYSTLLHALKGESPTAAGFIWRYADDDRPVLPVKLAVIHRTDNPRKKPRPVQQTDVETGRVIGVFPNMASAGKSVGISGSAVYYACTGKSKTAGGYRWNFV